jgi:hypothetical protein
VGTKLIISLKEIEQNAHILYNEPVEKTQYRHKGFQRKLHVTIVMVKVQ